MALRFVVVLYLQISPGLTVVLIWRIPSPYQNIGGGIFLLTSHHGSLPVVRYNITTFHSCLQW